MNFPSHVESLGDRQERRSEVVAGRVDVELDALQEEPGGGVGMLIGLDDVAARAGDERTDRGDDSGLVRALEQEHGAHVCSIGRRAAQKSVRSGSTAPRNRSRSIWMQATPLLSAYTLACGLICCATNRPSVGENCGSRSRRS